MLVIKAKTINDLWYRTIRAITETDCASLTREGRCATGCPAEKVAPDSQCPHINLMEQCKGYKFGKFRYSYPTGMIQHGSFMNEQSRLMIRGFYAEVEYPYVEGSNDHIVTLPEGSSIPAPTTKEVAEEYFLNYLLGSELAENETYTYGSRINHPLRDKDGNIVCTQLEKVIDLLQKTPVTNQAVIEIASPEDLQVCVGNDGSLDPPCLRKIDFKVIPAYKPCDNCQSTGKDAVGDKCPACKGQGQVIDRQHSALDMQVDFRSWDLAMGMGTNLAGLALFQNYVSQMVDIPVGKMFCQSVGLHLYKYQKEVAEMRLKSVIHEF